MAERIIPHNPMHEGMVDLRVNIVYSTQAGEKLALQMLKPRWSSGGEGFPLVVFIQGSAWQKPDQFWQLPQLNLLARQGFVIASVTHRSCWDAAAPAFLQDVKTALRYLRAHASEYDIDKSRVCAWGTSSGGNTALLLGLTGDDPAYETEEWAGESTAVQAVVDCFGPTDLVTRFEKLPEELRYSDKNLFFALGGRNPDTCRDVLKEISPLHRVRPGEKLPPFLILHGDADDMVDYAQSEAMVQRLTECGYAADIVRVTNAPHEDSFWSMPLLEMIFAFIRAHL